jgi:hypothetical protein
LRRSAGATPPPSGPVASNEESDDGASPVLPRPAYDGDVRGDLWRALRQRDAAQVTLELVHTPSLANKPRRGGFFRRGGDLPLGVAARLGSVELTRALVRGGGEMDAIDRRRLAPVQHAVLAGHAEVVAYLLKKGASAFKEEPGYKGPHNNVLGLAIRRKQAACVRKILEHGRVVRTDKDLEAIIRWAKGLERGQFDANVITTLQERLLKRRGRPLPAQEES